MKTLLVLFLICSAFAHEGHHHGEHTQVAKREEARPDLKSVYAEIQDDYQKSVRPIFDSKCAACHSATHEPPWYAAIPVVGWIIESDRKEAKEHLEISQGFPFAGHGTVGEDFDAIRTSIAKSKMPTRLYRFFHPSTRITPDEASRISNWIANSENRIKSGQEAGVKQ